MKYIDTLSGLPAKQEKSFRTFPAKKIWPVAAAAALLIGAVYIPQKTIDMLLINRYNFY